MLRPGSYFPPADCWSSRLPSPEVPAPAPLLPTPIPTALPSTLGGTLNEQPPDLDVDLPLSHPPPCSCPVNDTCIAEYLALLLGSFKLLHQILLALQEPDDGSSQHDTTTLKATFCATATALSKFETSVKKILESLLDSEEFGLSELLLQQWRRPIEPLPEEEDICFSIRRKIDGLLINVVDTFPPIQHNLHMLLVRYEFGSSRLQTMLQELQSPNAGPGTKLLLEANRQLVQFSVKSDHIHRESLLNDLEDQVDCFVRQVDRRDSDVVINGFES